MKRFFAVAILCAASSVCFAAPRHHAAQPHGNTPPECSHWPVTVAPVMLHSNGLLNSLQDIDESKTQVKRLSAHWIGKDLYVQIYDITYHLKSGGTIHIITRNNASSEECSMDGPDVYVVSRVVRNGDVLPKYRTPPPSK